MTLIVVVSLPTLLYIPMVQNFLRDQVTQIVSRNSSMKLSVGSLRLRFPFTLQIERVQLLTAPTDTLFGCQRAYLDLSLLPLFRGEVQVKSFQLEQVQLQYVDTVGRMALSGRVAELALSVDPAQLFKERVVVPTVALKGADVALTMGVSPPDTLPNKESTPLKWAIELGEVSLEQLQCRVEMAQPNMTLDVVLPSAQLSQMVVDLGLQKVVLHSLAIDEAGYTYLTTPDEIEERVTEVSDSTSQPWWVSLHHLKLQNNRATYAQRGAEPVAGLDVNYLSFSHLDLELDSLENCGSSLSAQLKSLSVQERSGLNIEQLSGGFVMDSTQLSLDQFRLQTPNTTCALSASVAGNPLQGAPPQSPVTAQLLASIGWRDIAMIVPSITTQLPSWESLPPITLDGSLAGTLDSVQLSELRVAMASQLACSMQGGVNDVLTPKNLSAWGEVEGQIVNPNFWLKMVDGVEADISSPIDLKLQATLNDGVLTPNLQLTVAEGELSLSGVWREKSESYRAQLLVDKLPLAKMLPDFGLGTTSLQLSLKGKGYDPLSRTTQLETQMNLTEFSYNGADYGGSTLTATLKDGAVAAQLRAEAPALQGEVTLSGNVAPNVYSGEVEVDLRNLDLLQMGFSEETIIASGHLALSGSYKAGKWSEFGVDITGKEIALNLNDQPFQLPTLALNAASRPDVGTALAWQMPHFSMQCSTSKSVEDVMAYVGELQQKRFDIQHLLATLPDYRLEGLVEKDAVVAELLLPQDVAFQSFAIYSNHAARSPLSLEATIASLEMANGGVDTLRFTLDQQQTALYYALNVGRASEGLKAFTDLRLYGEMENNRVDLFCAQQSSQGEPLFDVGITTQWSDSLVHISLQPENMVLGGSAWHINPNNYLTYHFDRRIEADLELQTEGKRLHLHSLDILGEPGGQIAVSIKGLELAPLLVFTPIEGELSGVLGADFTIGFRADMPQLRGGIALAQFTYNKQRVGEVATHFDYEMVSPTTQQVSASLAIDSARVFALSGNYQLHEQGDTVDLNLEIPQLPLSLGNLFLSPEMAQLQGNLVGNIAIKGSPQQPQLAGYLQLPHSSVQLPMVGTSLKMGDDTIKIAESVVYFDHYPIVAANRNPLTIAGEVSLEELTRPTVALDFSASDWQLFNTTHSRKALAYGRVAVDVATTIRGEIDQLQVRGGVGVLNGTDVTYQMQSSPIGVKQQDAELVTFVNFNDTEQSRRDTTTRYIRPTGIDMLLNVEIANAVKVGVNLSPDGQNRVELQGGGELSYAMNLEGDSRFSGKYELSGGSVRYSPPIIAEKVFAIESGSFVEWTGDMLDPRLNITAIETEKASVTEEGSSGGSRMVDFEVIIAIKNSLKELAITFDLAATNDLTIQNQLAALTPEQRANEAMNMLIYNTYMGGNLSSITGNPLNSFIQRELNSWSRNNLKVVDLSFGIDTQDGSLVGSRDSGTSYSYKVSKSLFDDRVKVVIGGHYSTDSEEQGDVAQNLLNDLSIEYMLNKRENMFLKVFRQTGYESILEGEIIQTGVGFVFRKKLLHLKDLFKPTSKIKAMEE